jgi:hypothetical protein
MNKFLLLCSPTRGVALQIFYDSEGRGEEIINNFSEHALYINHDQTSITHLLFEKPTLRADSGVIFATYRLTDELLRKISLARTVGIAMKPPHNTTIFMGFIDMPFAEGAQKLSGFLNVCRQK